MSDYTQLYVRFLQRFHCQHLKVFKFWTFERIFYIIITWIMIIMRFYSNGLCCLTFGDRLRLPIISFSDLPPTQLNVQPKLQGLSLPPNCQHNPVMSSEYFLKIGKEVEINVEPKLQVYQNHRILLGEFYCYLAAVKYMDKSSTKMRKQNSHSVAVFAKLF